MKVPVILQARMGSSRLPGKSLREIEGKPLLQWVIERLRLSLSGEVILATTRKGEDDPLASLAERLGVPVFRGSESDVLSRYYRVSLLYPAPYDVRATGDNPLVDPGSIDRLLKVIEGGGIDYALEKGLPYGGATEIFTRQALLLKRYTPLICLAIPDDWRHAIIHVVTEHGHDTPHTFRCGRKFEPGSGWVAPSHQHGP